MDDTDKLEDFPRIGRRGEAEGTHELVLPSLPYRLVYEVDDGKKEVRILRVMHTSRRWPEE
jgi:plasmid stabilization system protein ParE